MHRSDGACTCVRVRVLVPSFLSFVHSFVICHYSCCLRVETLHLLCSPSMQYEDIQAFWHLQARANKTLSLPCCAGNCKNQDGVKPELCACKSSGNWRSAKYMVTWLARCDSLHTQSDIKSSQRSQSTHGMARFDSLHTRSDINKTFFLQEYGTIKKVADTSEVRAYRWIPGDQPNRKFHGFQANDGIVQEGLMSGTPVYPGFNHSQCCIENASQPCCL